MPTSYQLKEEINFSWKACLFGELWIMHSHIESWLPPIGRPFTLFLMCAERFASQGSGCILDNIAEHIT